MGEGSVIHLVTAVSRPENLSRIHKSITLSLSRSSLKAKWILVVDGAGVIQPDVEARLRDGPFEVEQLVHRDGKCSYGIDQKNAAMDSISDGYYHCIDDDNIVHRDFFHGLERAMAANPKKRAFVFGQQRWDNIKDLVASPDRMEYGKIDNTMFVVHKSLIGGLRYDLTRSGREDFHFFRKLYDLYREEFVFISETLAYYNYIKHFPSETKLETTPVETAKRIAPSPAHQPAAVPKVPGVLKIALYSSNRERCGISTYTSQLEEAFTLLGHEVRHWGSQPPYEETFNEIRAWSPDVFHIQHETSIMPPEGVLEKHASLMSRSGTRVLVTLHTESEDAIRLARRATSSISRRIVMHRPTPSATDAVVIPMPCTPSGVTLTSGWLRRRFGFPEDAFVVSTVGFMIPWKDHPRLVEALLPWVESRPSVHLQVIASEHFNESLRGYAQSCREQLSRLASGAARGRIHHIDGYPSDQELIERLIASNLGYVWCPFDTGSSSAAAAQFTTARCPLVATDSSHYAFLGTGIIRGPKGNLGEFARLIQKTAEDPELLRALRANQWAMYRERNYIETARKHLLLYEGEAF